jgi:hypothetical protein
VATVSLAIAVAPRYPRRVAAVLRWSFRVFALLAMVLFAVLMVIFVIVTVDQFGQKQYVTDSVAGLPPVYLITALLVPCCAAFVAGFWMLLLDSFKERPGDGEETPVARVPERERLRERVARWSGAHRPHWPSRAD